MNIKLLKKQKEKEIYDYIEVKMTQGFDYNGVRVGMSEKKRNDYANLCDHSDLWTYPVNLIGLKTGILSFATKEALESFRDAALQFGFEVSAAGSMKVYQVRDCQTEEALNTIVTTGW
jgi:hypothetical protein